MSIFDAIKKSVLEGFSAEITYEIVIDALDVKGKMREIMQKAYSLTETTDNIGGHRIVSVTNYKDSTVTDIVSGRVEKLCTPSDDVISYTLEDGTTVIVRPSGTEPKFKVYSFISADNMDGAKEKLSKIRKSLSWIEE